MELIYDHICTFYIFINLFHGCVGMKKILIENTADWRVSFLRLQPKTTIRTAFLLKEIQKREIKKKRKQGIKDFVFCSGSCRNEKKIYKVLIFLESLCALDFIYVCI